MHDLRAIENKEHLIVSFKFLRSIRSIDRIK